MHARIAVSEFSGSQSWSCRCLPSAVANPHSCASFVPSKNRKLFRAQTRLKKNVALMFEISHLCQPRLLQYVARGRFPHNMCVSTPLPAK
jgi:hypothetical protein